MHIMIGPGDCISIVSHCLILYVYGRGFENNQHTKLDVINIPRCPNGGHGWSCSYRDRFGAKMAISQMWKCEAWLYLKFEWGEYFLCTTKQIHCHMAKDRSLQ